MMTETTRPTTYTESWTVGIRTRYYGPGNVRGSRVTAWRADQKSPRDDSMSVTVQWDYALSSSENHTAAVRAYVEAHNAAGHDWSGEWVIGSGHDGYMAVRTPPTVNEPR